MSHGKYKAFSKDSSGAEKVLKVEYTWKKKKKMYRGTRPTSAGAKVPALQT